MHQLERDLLQAILDNPDDDAPRLVYADWLIETGAPERGELIQIQCALANHPDEAKLEKLQAREEQLMRRYRWHWGDYRPWLTGCEWRRGFIERATTEGQTFIDSINELLRMMPLQSISLLRMEPKHFSKLAKKKSLQRIRALSITHDQIGPKQAAILFGPSSANVVGLRSLDISFSPLKDATMTILASSPYLHQLEELRVAHAEVTLEGLETLSKHAAFFPSLRKLDISRVEFGYHGGSPPIPEDQGCYIVELLERAKSIEHLSIRGWNIGDEGLKALADSPAFANLQSIELLDNRITNAGALALTKSPHLKRLRKIEGLIVRRSEYDRQRFVTSGVMTGEEENDNRVMEGSSAAKAIERFCEANQRERP